MSHTPEPWFAFCASKTTSVMDRKRGEIIHWAGFDGSTAKGSLSLARRHGNARRIVAAVNHTRNIPNEALEAVRLEEVVEASRPFAEAQLPGHVLAISPKASDLQSVSVTVTLGQLKALLNVLSHFPARSSTVEPGAHNVSDAGSTPAAPTTPERCPLCDVPLDLTSTGCAAPDCPIEQGTVPTPTEEGEK